MRIRAVRDEQDAVDLEMTAKTIRLTFTDSPRSPEPPANDLVEAPRKSLGRGLWGVGRRMGSVLQDVLQNPGRAGQGVDGGNDAFDEQPRTTTDARESFQMDRFDRLPKLLTLALAELPYCCRGRTCALRSTIRARGRSSAKGSIGWRTTSTSSATGRRKAAIRRR